MVRLRPSAAPRWVPCPGSVTLQEQFPEPTEKDDDAAKEGTAAHWVASSSLESYQSMPGTGGLILTAQDFSGMTHANGVIITQEMIDSANQYIAEVLRICQADGLLQSMKVEKLVKVPRVHPTENEGTPDVSIFDAKKGVLHVIDFKHGHGIVEIFENFQLVNYGIGLVDELRLDDRMIRINFKVVQPRSYHPDGTIREWSVKGDNLRALGNIMQNSAYEALGDDPKCNTGSHCRECTGRRVCQALNRSSMNSIDVSQGIMIEEIPNDEISVHYNTLKKAKEMIANRLTGIESQIIGSLRNGATVHGLALHNPPGRLDWSKDIEEVKMLGMLMDKEMIQKPKLITPTQAKNLGIDEAVINAYSVRKSGSVKIVDSDTTTAAKTFGKK